MRNLFACNILLHLESSCKIIFPLYILPLSSSFSLKDLFSRLHESSKHFKFDVMNEKNLETDEKNLETNRHYSKRILQFYSFHELYFDLFPLSLSLFIKNK